MAEPLPTEVEASYSAIIDEILRGSDLNTISAKRIRKGLQERVEYDTTHQKDQITALIMQRFDKFNSEQNGSSEPSEPIPTVENGAKATNGDISDASNHKRSPDDESALSELEDFVPPKKKVKKSKVAEDDDAAYAARLQAEENARMRSTRGGNTKRKAPAPKKKTKKKSSNKVKDEDDSDIASGSGGEKKSPSRKGGFHVRFTHPSPTAYFLNHNLTMSPQKPMALSPALSELLGETQLSRPQTVKKIWEYVKERELQDPSDKRQIRCDDAMRAVFKQDRVHMFTMNKILNQNLYAVDEVN
ncbi:SWIB-domain-containing protein [Cucurbitaria berberidis CBS 394.84]|uniref:SWIB-domain-containing protein n=1 Tax=Cucurbitaria berberidis CBS 394.84 TaxID=1168544 RepID=A0A9P4GHX0_9PLEO|nr:SWIB-domain-containing protein [Cucurbitaria berberidis CBS 394.84]KAF1845731.1 SWIB-domain-containing protein [Cucurbitaria berberidis CBS 394.84]